MKNWLSALILGCLLTAPLSYADEIASPTLATVVEKQLGVKPQRIVKTPYLGGLYEVYAGGQLFYSDEKGSVFVFGSLIDGKTLRNITAEQQLALMPLQDAIKRVNGNGGNGKRTLITFEDPNCGYCKRLAKEMQKLDNVTIYVFLYPILSEDSVRKSKQIWCSADRSRAWNDWMIDGKTPSGREDCDTSAVTKNQEFGRKLNISGTPTIFFADGERVPGAVPLARIEQKLNQVK